MQDKHRFHILPSSDVRIEAGVVLEFTGSTQTVTADSFGALQDSVALLSPSMKRWRGLNWLSDGDSVTARPGNWTGPVASYLEVAQHVNVAVDGTRMVEVFTHIPNAAALAPYDLLTISMGSNDFGRNTFLGGHGDAPSQDSFYALVAWVIETMIGYKPTIRLVMTTPMQRFDQATPNAGGFVLQQYVDAIIQVAGDYAIPVLDMYRISGLNQYTLATYTPDGLHPTALGYANTMVNPLQHWLESI
jgi:lysophospholipase L1-like esterase